MTSTEPSRPMRADARENREKLLRAAAASFAQGGPDVPLEAVARGAGVGIGTLYRHFATREALIEAVYRHEVDGLCTAADTLLDEQSPATALAEWMERFVAYATTKRGLAGALKAVAGSQPDLFSTTRERLLATVTKLLAAGVDAGQLRGDVRAGDVLASMNAIWAISGDGDEWAAQARRILRLLMDGLRYGAGDGTESDQATAATLTSS